MTLSFGFPPITSPLAQVLVLGTLPGRRSIELGEYYAHPQNAFWKIMAMGIPDLPSSYAIRAAVLTAHGIALWDVLAAATRSGSLDSAISEDAIANNFQAFFHVHAQVQMICFNGKTAADLFETHVTPHLSDHLRSIDKHILPSTSSAHAGVTLLQKAAAWSVIWRNTLERK